MSDKEIVSALIRRDEKVTEQFFYKDCRPLFLSIIHRVFDKQHVDYDEIINDIYVLLIENNAYRLRQFHFNSTLYQWLKTIAIRHCTKLKQRNLMIDMDSKEPLLNDNGSGHSAVEDSHTKMDIEALLRQMKNQRYATVIRMLMIDGHTPDETARLLSITVDNLYNIKRRAISALTEVALKDKRHYAR